MKLKAIAFITLVLFSSACFYIPGDGANSRVALMLAKVPADVAKIHVAVCQGSVTEENVLTIQTFEPTSAIVVQASPGPDRIVEVIGVNRQGYAAYCGTSLPMTFEEGSETVSLNVQPINLTTTTFTVAEHYSPYDYVDLSWSPNWFEKYEIQRAHLLSAPAESDYRIVFNNYGNYFKDVFTINGGWNVYYRIRAYSPIFDVYTPWVVKYFNRT